VQIETQVGHIAAQIREIRQRFPAGGAI